MATYIAGRRRRRFLLTGIICTVGIVAVGIGSIFYSVSQTAVRNPFSADIQKSAHTVLYYPARLPSGYVINHSSIDQPANGVTTVELTGEQNTIYMSQQKLPKELNLELFYTR